MVAVVSAALGFAVVVRLYGSCGLARIPDDPCLERRLGVLVDGPPYLLPALCAAIGLVIWLVAETAWGRRRRTADRLPRES